MASKLKYKLLSGHEMPLIGCTYTKLKNVSK